MNVLKVSAVKKTFAVGLRQRKVHAVKRASFHVEKGEIVGLIGPNGAGKTTTLKMITGMVKPDEGDVSIFGGDARNVESRTKLGYLPEGPYFYEHLNVDELLMFYGRLFGISKAELRPRIDTLIKRVGLDHARDRTLRKFSKGMRQRAGIAQALINDPEFVILDEPQTGLDPVGRKEVRDLIVDLNKEGKTILFSSHILPDVEAVCDRVVMMHMGNVVGEGTLDELTAGTAEHIDIIVQSKSVPDVPGLMDAEPRGNLI